MAIYWGQQSDKRGTIQIAAQVVEISASVLIMWNGKFKIGGSNSKQQLHLIDQESDKKSFFKMYLNQVLKTSSVFVLLIFVSLLLIKNVQSQKYQREEDVAAGERVEKLASAVGDLYQQPSWYQQSALNRKQVLAQEAPFDSNEYQIIGSVDGPRVIPSNFGGLQRFPFGNRNDKMLQYLDLDETGSGYNSMNGLGRNYRALADDFKHSAQLSNPLREGRAFKPKLMSTARGFGKRAEGANGFRVSYADLLASAGANGALNGKMSGKAIR